MKKVLVLTRFRGEYEPTRLKKEAIELGYEVDLVNYEKVSLGVSSEGLPMINLGTGSELDDYDLIVPRAASAKGKRSMVGVKTVILEYVENLNRFRVLTKKIEVLNGESFKMFPLMGKLEQGIMLAQNGLGVVPFMSFNGKKGWSEYLKSVPVLPVMVKMRFGSHGKNVKLAETQEKIIKLAEKYSDGTVLIQPVLKVRRWYRVIVLRGEVVGMMKHKQKTKFQDEITKEEMALVRPSFTEEQLKDLGEMCVKACKVFEVDYAGLDVAWEEEKKKWIIFEINRTAQFKWFEKAHPEVNVARFVILN